MSKINSTINKSVKSISNAFKKIGSTIKQVITTIALAGIGKQFVDIASDMEEVQNVVNQAFGEMASQAEYFAQKCAYAFGLSELQAKRTSSTFMAMARGMDIYGEAAKTMSLQLTALSGDMASFYNVSQSLADTALQSIFTGETETLKKFGIVLTEANLKAYALSKGITKSYTEMSQAEKVAIRYNYVMEQTSIAQGDFSRTSNSWANQIRILKLRWEELGEAIGTILTNVLLPVLNVLNNILSVIVGIAKGFASMFGAKPDTNPIKDSGDSFVDVTDDIDGATEAAEEYKRTIAGFDEINRLEAPTKKEDIDLGLGQDFELIEPYDFSALEQATGKFKLVLEDLIKKFNDFINKINEGVKKLRRIFDNFAKTIADAVNSIFKNVDFNKIGELIGNLINAVSQFLWRLFTDIDFELMGKRFAEMVNSIFETVSWETVGMTIGRGIMAIWNFLYGFVTNLDYKLIGESFTTLISNAFLQIDFDKIAKTIYTAINGIITIISEIVNNVGLTDILVSIQSMFAQIFGNINFEELGKTIHNALISIFDSIQISSEMGYSIAENIGKGIADFFKGLDVMSLIGPFFKAVSTVISDFWDGIFGKDTILSNIAEAITKIVLAIQPLLPLISGLVNLLMVLNLSGLAQPLEMLFEKITNLGGSDGYDHSLLEYFQATFSKITGAIPAFFATMNAKWTEGLSGIIAGVKNLPTTIISSLQSIPSAITGILTGVQGAFSGILTSLQAVPAMFVNIGATIAGAISNPMGALTGILTGVKGAFSSLFAVISANPFTAFVVAIGTVVGALITAYNTNEQFRQSVDDFVNNTIKPAIEAIGKVFSELWENHLKPLFDKLFSGEDALLPKIIGFVTPIIEQISVLIGQLVLTVLPPLIAILTEIFEIAGPIIGNIIDGIGSIIDVLGGLIDFLTGVFTGDWELAWQGICDVFVGIFETMANLIKVPVNLIIGIINAIVQAVSGVINFVVDAINTISVDIPDWVPGIGGKTLGFNLPNVEAPQIPTFANGGVLTGPTVGLMGEYPGASNNPEIVTPQSLMLETMEQANMGVINAIYAMASMLNKTIEEKDTDIYMDSTKVTRKISKEQEKQKKNKGTSLVYV